MIQRIQSVYLLLGVLICGMLFFFPIAEYINDASSYVFDICGVKNITDEAQPEIVNTLPVLIILIAVMLTGMISIFLFKNRKLQIRICSLNLLLLTALLAAIFLYSDKAETAIEQEGTITSFGFGTVVPIIALIFTFLAIRGIKKDEELVRSADRIR